MAVEFGLFGGVEARADGRPIELGHARQRSVLAALLIDANRVTSVEQLVDRVWGERSPQRAEGTLYSYVSRLRQALAPVAGEARLSRASGGYVLAVDASTVDLHRFRDLTARARTADDDGTAASLLEQALGLWRGELFASLDTPWFNSVRESLGRERFAAELDLGDVLLRLGRHAEMPFELAARTREHPLDERLAGQLMLALYRCGRPADALNHYRDLRSRLADDLGIDPGPELRHLHQQILTADPAIAVPSPADSPTTGAHPAPTPVPRQLPAPPPMFTGRDLEVKVLCGMLDPGEPRHAHVVAVDGVAGVGKSALALHASHRMAHGFPDGQLYVNLQGASAAGAPLTPYDVLVQWLPQLGVAGTDVPGETGAASALWRSVLAGRRLLLVLDDAFSAEQVRPLLPAERGCVTVVTSRSVLSTLDGAEFVHLEPLAQEEAVTLLERLAGAGRVVADPTAAGDVVGFCERLPLLLRIVAARLAARPSWSIRVIADRLAEEHRRLNELQAGELSARASLAVSLRETSEEGARVFASLAMVGVTELDLPLAASLAGLPWAAAEAVLEQLVDARLIDSPVPGRYRMHDVVRLYAREQARVRADTAGWSATRRRVLDHYLALTQQAALLLDPEEASALTNGPPPAHPSGFAFDDRSEASAWIDFVAPHLPMIMDELAGSDDLTADIALLALEAYPALVVRDRWTELIRLSSIAVRTARDGDRRVLEARAHNLLGMAYGNTGRLDESLAEFDLALRQWEKIGDRHQMARALNNLGLVARLRGDLPEAVRCHERSILLFQEVGDSNGQARALSNLGLVHQRIGDHDQAIVAHEEAAGIFRTLGDRYRLGLILGNLARSVRLAGRIRESLDRYQDSLRVIRETGNRSGEAEQLWGLAQALHDLGESDLARARWRAALDILRECGDLTAKEVEAILAQPVPQAPAAISRGV
ncbi:BTAD domain-containing putative transcriptional regulator [Streptosporangium sp. NPDC049376]|uniref:AfsR/SARP family transcriptional regulator n=1 Tax=Streptosporangium sp. NPDC049376 TaxID=3366192 RepID=UPI00379EA0A6